MTDLGIEGLTGYRRIGAGGFATVYAAHDGAFERTVAVKVLHVDSPDGYRRFERELSLMGRLGDHPNIVTAYRAGRTDTDAPYLVMEYLPGGSLADLLAKKGRLPVADALTIGEQIAAALGRAHSAGVLHRDVTPANILLATDGTVKLADFGVSHLRAATVTQRSFTPSHSPPETFADVDRRDERSDLYSLASVIHHLIAGRPPFDVAGGSLEGQISRILSGPVPPLGDDALDAFFAAAMAKAPEDRFGTAAELAAALAKISRARASDAPTTDRLGQSSALAPAGATKPLAGPLPTPDRSTSDGAQTTGTPEEDASARERVRGRPRQRIRGRHVLAGSAAVIGLLATALAVDAARSLPADPTSDQASSTTSGSESERTTTTVSPSVDDAADADTDADTDVSTSPPVPVLVPVTLNGHQATVTEIVELPDGRIASGDESGVILVREPTEEGSEPVTLAATGGEEIWDLAALADGQLASASIGGAVQIWTVDGPDAESVALAPVSGAKAELAVLSDGRLAAANLNGPVQVWDPAEPWTPTAELVEPSRVVNHLTPLPDGRVAYVNLVGVIQVWDPKQPETDPFPLSGVFNNTSHLASLPDGGLAVGSFEGVVVAYDDVNLSASVSTYDAPHEQIWYLDSLADGRLAIGTAGAAIHVWAVGEPEGELVYLDEGPGDLTAMVALTDGRLVFADDQGVVRLWDGSRPGEEPTIVAEHAGSVRALIELSDGRIASGGNDGTIKISAAPDLGP